MPASLTNVHVDTLLTNIAGGYKNASYIADGVLPILPVGKESGKIAQYGTDHYRVDFTARALGANPQRFDWQAATPLSYAALEWTLEKPVDDREAALYDSPFDAYKDASLFLSEKIALKRELLVATLLTTAGNFGGTTTGGAWSGAGTPVANIRTAVTAIVARTGIAPSEICVAMSYKIWSDVVQNAEFKNMFLNTVPGAAGPGMAGKLTNPTPENLAMAAGVIGVGAIYVGTAVYNTAAEGQTDSFSWVWGTTTCAVFAKAARPSLMNGGFGLLLSPTVPGVPGATIGVDQYRDERARSQIIRASALFKEVVVTKACGQIINTIS